ncbi:MAG: hypothetical protein JW910_17555 [Anaerolineae bacterium]|nr:hypothetical protein [Anaerolineae bacterium]
MSAGLSAQTQPVNSPIGDGLDWSQAVRSGSFAVVAVTADERGIDARTAQLELTVEEGSGGPEVTVTTVDLPASAGLFLHLSYDAASFNPTAVTQGADIEGRALMLGVTSPEDHVVIALAMPGLAPELSGGLELARVKFNHGAHAAQRTVSVAPAAPVSDLRFLLASPETLRWTFTNPGDFDQNSEVGAADITPIAQYYLATSTGTDWPYAQVADGDSNGEVNSADMVIIAQNYLNTLTGYAVQTSAEESGTYSDLTEIAFATSTVPASGGFRYYEHALSSPAEGDWFAVTAMHGTERAAARSNAVQYSSTVTINPPTDLSATTDGTAITLHWTAPTPSTPTSYTVYVSLFNDLSDSVSQSGITATNHTMSTIYSPDSEWYFGVKANYDGTLSGYSNIYHYEPGAGTPAPTGLSAVKSGTVIAASWTAPTGNTPMHYDLFVDTASDLSSAVLAVDDVAATSANLPGLFSAENEYYLGVKANYDEGQSDYSNIFHYTPGGTGDDTPPSWGGGLPDGGIKSAAGGNASAEIQWWEASDADSPPVDYLIFYAEHATGIDWGTHQQTAATGTTSLIITGLANDVAYDFGVRARDNSGNITTNTNYLSATPSAAGTPIDSGVWRASELVDDGGTIPNQDVGWFTDIEVKSDGTIGVAHHNESGGDLLYSEQPGGTGAWTTVTVTSNGDTGQWPDLEFNPATGYPCIAYHNVDEASLEYAEFDGTEWTITVVDDSSADVGAFAALEFDQNNFPGIAYFDAIANDTRYAHWNNNTQSWQIEVAFNGGSAGDGIGGSFCDLRYNPVTGNPAIVTRNSSDGGIGGMSTAKYAYYTGTSWSSEDAVLGPYSDLSIDTAGWANSLAFDAAGNPRVITVEMLGEVMVGTKSGAVWTETSVGDAGQLAGGAVEQIYTDMEFYDGAYYWLYFNKSGSVEFGSGFSAATTLEGGGNGGFPSLAAANDTLYAAYLDSTGGQLRVARKATSGGAWAYEIADSGAGGEGVVGERASLAFHPAGNYPMISYYDASNSAQKYADRQPGSWRTETVSNTANDGGAGGLVVRGTGEAIIGFFSVSTTTTAVKTATGSYGSWTKGTVFESNITVGGDAMGNYCAVGLPVSGTQNPGIAYHNTTQRRLEFAQLNAVGGSEVTTVYEFNDPGRFNSVAYNPASGFAGIAFLARDTSDLYFVQRSGAGAWSPIAVDTAGMVGTRLSLCYGTDTARPWISYYDDTNKRLKVAYVAAGGDWETAGDWNYITIDAPNGSTDYGSYSSIAWHPEHNRAAVVFFDADHGQLWYQFIGDPGAPQAAVAVTDATVAEGLWPSLKFDASTNQPGIAYYDVENGDLRYVGRNAS